ncbi:GOLPH3/VPS74 family protein [Ferrimonas pelagia]|uniref:GPP34 family phosphoprotein n=1 Tax=Ferrimonas pelagia TaxID=1177826 RepID=A0ABP9EA33_9GAMM
MIMPLYQSYLLLALHDEKGSSQTMHLELGLATAIIAQLIYQKQIILDCAHKPTLSLEAHSDDPLIARSLDHLRQHQEPSRGWWAQFGETQSLKGWIASLAEMKTLKQDAVTLLCDANILQRRERSLLFVFSRTTFPERNPQPEQALLARLRDAIEGDHVLQDAEISILLALLKATGLMQPVFGDSAERRADRIDALIQDLPSGQAAQELIAAIEAALLVTVILPTVISTTQ